LTDTALAKINRRDIVWHNCQCNCAGEILVFSLTLIARFFLNYFQSYHAVIDCFSEKSAESYKGHHIGLRLLAIALTLLTIVAYLMVRWRSLHEWFYPRRSDLQQKPEEKNHSTKNPYPKISFLIFLLNFIGILALSAYAAIESIHSTNKVIIGGVVILSMFGVLPTTILFSKKHIEQTFININEKKLPLVKSIFIAIGTLCMIPLIVIALHTICTGLMGMQTNFTVYLAWSLSIIIGLGYVVGELFINCRQTQENNSIKALLRHYKTSTVIDKKIKLVLAVCLALVFLLGASLVMASGAYIGTRRLLTHMTSTFTNQAISSALFFITLFVAIFGSFGEDFLGKMVNKMIPIDVNERKDCQELSPLY
jgi:hypothetical protein